MKDLLEYLLLSLFRGVILLLPFRTVQRLGDRFGGFVFRRLPLRQGLVMENLRAAYPELPDEERRTIADLSYRNIFTTFFETFWIPRMDLERLRSLVIITPEERQRVDAIMARGKGMIILSGHITNWELVAIGIGALTPYPLELVIKRQRNAYVDRLMNGIRTSFANTVVEMDRAPREVIRRLRDGKAVGMLADQSGPDDGIFVDFFGRPTSTHAGPAVFALRTGTPIVVTTGIRTAEGTFTVHFEELPMAGLHGTDDEKIREITRRHTAALERHVRRHPGQWLWLHKRWKHTDRFLHAHPTAS